jgi:hypothetical protein
VLTALPIVLITMANGSATVRRRGRRRAGLRPDQRYCAQDPMMPDSTRLMTAPELAVLCHSAVANSPPTVAPIKRSVVPRDSRVRLKVTPGSGADRDDLVRIESAFYSSSISPRSRTIQPAADQNLNVVTVPPLAPCCSQTPSNASSRTDPSLHES